jgi:hypothetical protein
MFINGLNNKATGSPTLFRLPQELYSALVSLHQN